MLPKIKIRVFRLITSDSSTSSTNYIINDRDTTISSKVILLVSQECHSIPLPKTIFPFPYYFSKYQF